MAIGHLHKRDKVWYARYKDRNGRLRWKSLETNSKEIAKGKLSKILEALEKESMGWQLSPKAIPQYLQEYLDICKAEHSPRTYRHEKQILEDFLKFCKPEALHQITADRVEAYKVKRVHDVSKSTVNRAVTVIKAFLNRAVMLGYLEKNPAQFVKKFKEDQKQIQYLADQDIKKLLEVCSPRVRQLVTVFLHTGMRLGELSHLRWEDVDFRHNLIHVQNQEDWKTKNYKPRVIPMHPIVHEIFKGLPHEHKYVFPTGSGRPIESYIRSEILRYAKKAKVNANVKMFRSTFASNLVMTGVDIYTVSKLLGHYDVKITEKHYAHLTPDFLAHSISRLSFPAKEKLELPKDKPR